MNTMFVLFVSACMYGSCAWFEITDPHYGSAESCIKSGQSYAEEMQSIEPRAYGNIACIPQEDVEEFRQFIKEKTGSEPQAGKTI